MHRITRILLLLLVATAAATSRADNPARFDYYLLSLSWSPQYCAATTRTDELQCVRPYAFVIHGLWPQFERGYAHDCPAFGRVSDATIEHMLPIMPSRGLIIHEWRTHGSCTGLDARAYFATVERAYRAIAIPAPYRAVTDYLTQDTAQIKRAFATDNPALPIGSITLQCSGPYLQEVHICVDRALSPRKCGIDQRDRCGARVVLRPTKIRTQRARG